MPFGLILGPDLPWEDEPSPGILGHSTAKFLTLLSLLMPAFSLVYSPPPLSVWLHPNIHCSSTDLHFIANPQASEVSFSPVTLSARRYSTSELLRTL